MRCLSHCSAWSYCLKVAVKSFCSQGACERIHKDIECCGGSEGLYGMSTLKMRRVEDELFVISVSALLRTAIGEAVSRLSLGCLGTPSKYYGTFLRVLHGLIKSWSDLVVFRFMAELDMEQSTAPVTNSLDFPHGLDSAGSPNWFP